MNPTPQTTTDPLQMITNLNTWLLGIFAAIGVVRLFMMALDILEKGEINTNRTKEHDLLMDIRFGKFQKEDGTYRDEFYEMLSDYENKLHYAADYTELPDEPDMDKVQELVMTVNERVVRDEI